MDWSLVFSSFFLSDYSVFSLWIYNYSKKLGKIAKYDSQLDFKCKSKPKLESNAKVT